MKLHDLQNPNPRQARKRVGRGNGNNWGRTCGRGEKGQLSRSGAKHRPFFEGGQIPLLRRLPKRGFENPNRRQFDVVNVGQLQERFEAGERVDRESLYRKGLVGDVRDGVKILGDGELDKQLTVAAEHFSAAAKAKIEAAGGECESL